MTTLIDPKVDEEIAQLLALPFPDETTPRLYLDALIVLRHAQWELRVRAAVIKNLEVENDALQQAAEDQGTETRGGDPQADLSQTG